MEEESHKTLSADDICGVVKLLFHSSVEEIMK